MFCGVVDGTRVSAVQLFDLRSTSGAVRKLRAAAKQRQPIHSICHTADDLLLSATVGGVWSWGGGTKGGEGGGGEDQAERLQTQVRDLKSSPSVVSECCCAPASLPTLSLRRASPKGPNRCSY